MRTRMRDADAIRDRAALMYRMKLGGKTAEMIGDVFSLTPRHVNREIAALPEEVRRRIRGTIRDAKR